MWSELVSNKNNRTQTYRLSKDLRKLNRILEINPENGTVWNMRKAMYINCGKAWLAFTFLLCLETEVERRECFEQELQATLKAIKQNPKAYSPWYHRKWTIKSHFGQEDAFVLCSAIEVKDLEVKQCDRLLELDARNCNVALLLAFL